MKIKDDAYGRLKYTYETRISCAVLKVELFILSFSDLFDFILHRFGRLQIHLANLSWILAFYFCTMNQSSYDYQVISSILLRINRLTASVIILVPLNCLHLVCVSISTSFYQFSLISAFMYSISPFFLFFSLSFSLSLSCFLVISMFLSFSLPILLQLLDYTFLFLVLRLSSRNVVTTFIKLCDRTKFLRTSKFIRTEFIDIARKVRQS